MRNVGNHLMTIGMQTAFFGYFFDSRLNSVEKELKDRSLKIQELTGKLKATESSAQTIASLEQSLLEARTKLTVVENEKGCRETIEHKKHLAEDKSKLDLDLDAVHKEIAIQHARGFHKAIDQVNVLNPAVDVEGVGIFKKIVEGKLVDESKDDEE
ncbi:hypothetical protein SESBI_12890 [Sesbania bispinosa]|nr:hypothetical protein SESBI_12890 [Sesbania bispinosa]